MSDFKSKLGKARQLHRDMTKLISICKNNESELDLWDIFWESFWDISKEFPFDIEWHDTDSSYKEDIMQRYNAIDEFIQCINKTKEV